MSERQSDDGVGGGLARWRRSPRHFTGAYRAARYGPRSRRAGMAGPGGQPGLGVAGLDVPAFVRRTALAMPWALIAAGALFALFTRQGLPGSPLFTASPLVAAPFASTVLTALTGAAAAGVLVMLLLLEVIPQQDGAARIATVLVVTVLAVAINRLLRRMTTALISARTIAEIAQYAVLPVPPSRIGDLQVAARYEAAQSGAHIGGDLYAVHEVPQGIRLIVGDVRGKGMQAVRTMAVVVGCFREAVRQEATLEGVARRLDLAMQREKEEQRGTAEYEDFTTAVIAEVPVTEDGVLRLVNRAHPPPLLLLPDGRIRLLEPAEPALPLGLSELGEWPERVEEVDFPPGSQILFYTDGLSEARDRSGTFYAPEERLAGRHFSNPEVLLDEVLADVSGYVREDVKDDMALVAVQRGAREA